MTDRELLSRLHTIKCDISNILSCTRKQQNYVASCVQLEIQELDNDKYEGEMK